MGAIGADLVVVIGGPADQLQDDRVQAMTEGRHLATTLGATHAA